MRDALIVFETDDPCATDAFPLLASEKSKTGAGGGGGVTDNVVADTGDDWADILPALSYADTV